MKQQETPLFTALRDYVASKPLQFHIPGHKRGSGMDPEFRDFIGLNALSIDLINIPPLDDLHNPHGIIKEAQILAAEAFLADRTFFSVQGTSGAIQAMILSVINPDDTIIVPRNIHRAVVTGLILSGARPVFLNPIIDERLGIAHGVTPESVKQALFKHPEAKGVLVINPTYYGFATDLVKIVEICHSRNVPVLVDEAHGIHIRFHDGLPLSAMQAGADLAATSVHKLGGSLVQSSVLNQKGCLVSPERVKTVISLLTTTSTSYILMASLDAARRFLAVKGQRNLERTMTLAENARLAINTLPGLYSPGTDLIDEKNVFSYDPTKLLIHVKDLGHTGHEIDNWLRSTYNIEVELSDLYNILCVISIGDNEETVGTLVKALMVLSRESEAWIKVPGFPSQLPHTPELCLSPREAFYSKGDAVPLEKALGKITKEMVMVYPPGIPIVMPGEIINQSVLEYIKDAKSYGLPIQGPEDTSLETIKIVAL
ncbi:MAG: aminotransferase class I/II-fold pyridoxal phosphate-dependent enzyme [Firmicutes bacterium]|nr:aminotransferase class I/II-fold pyridoxal phosphate-dependent enzyme [Bacillota bacterium]